MGAAENISNVTFEDILLPGLCDEPLWSANAAWHTDTPQFGRCVERTLLLWAPCLVLWVSAPFYSLALMRRPYDPVPWSALAYTKVLVMAVVMAAAVTEGIWAVTGGYTTSITADFLAPLLLVATYALYLFLLVAERRRGRRSSGVLWIYWLVAVVAGALQFSTALNTIIHQEGQLPLILAVTIIVQYLGYVILFIASCVNDVPSRLQELTKTKNQNPEIDASFVNRLFFFYNLPLIWRGFLRPLVYDDLPEVLPRNSAEAVYRRWRNTLDRKEGRPWEEFMVVGKAATATAQNKTKVSLVWHVWRQNQSTILLLLILAICFENIVFLNPVLVGWLIEFMGDESEPTWHGYLYAVLLAAMCEMRSLMKNAYIKDILVITVRVRTALMAAVYNKAIYLSSASRRRFTVGEIVNLMAVDAQTIGDTFLELNNIVTNPLVILITTGFVWAELGPSALAGLAVMLMLIPLNSHILSHTKTLQTRAMKVTDSRVKVLSEIINGIKVLKLYAWEASFSEQVNGLRNEEVKLLKRLALYKSLHVFFFNTTPFLVTLATFTTYLFVSDENQLDAKKIFVCITLFDILRMPIIVLPEVISKCIHGAVSLRRMERYLNTDELDPLDVTSDPRQSSAVVVQGGCFSWEGDEEQDTWRLKDIELNVRPGQLVALVGTVGSGKSSILSALLGEMKKVAGNVVVNGSVAYVPQLPWLQNATLRDNITWGQAYDTVRYRQVVRACALQADLDVLPAGDLTEIGENGINMSGGQKQRISLARAVYSSANVFFLDDPLSAVDSHVGRHIFDHVLGPNGLLKDKTRVLVTHAVTFLPQVDEVVVVADGQVAERGTYTSLLTSEGSFAKFMLQHIKELDEEEADTEMEVLHDQLESVDSNMKLYRQLSNTRQSLKSSQSYQPSGTSSPHLNSSRLSMSSKTSGFEGKPHLQHQLSTDSSVSGFMHTKKNGSVLTLDSHAAKSLEAEGNDNDQKLIMDETSEIGNVSFRVYFIYMKAMGVLFTCASFITFVLSQVCFAWSRVWLADWSSEHSNVTDNTSASRNAFLLVYGLFAVAQSIFLFMGIVMMAHGTLKAANALHSGLLKSVLHLPMSFFDTNPSGRIMNRFSKEIDKVDKKLPIVVRSCQTTLIQVVTTLVVIIAATPVVAFMVVPIMIVYFAIQRVFVATSRQVMRLESVSKSPIYSHFSETVAGVSVIRAFKRQDEFFSQSLQKMEDSQKSIYANITANRWLAIHLETIGNLIIFASALFGVANRLTISPGAVGLTVSFALSITMLLNWLVRMVSDLEASIVSVEKIDEYMQLPQEAAWKVDQNTPPSAWPEQGCINFHNYETRYRPGLSLVLRNITCSISPAEKVGIVGRTGAGKSSLTLALFRIIEASGGGIDIDNITIGGIGLHDLRSQISIIPQDAVLFSGTLRMNLDPLNHHSDDELWRALELAHLSDYIRKQVLGLQHPVDQGGSNFSAGQKQLLCLARALLRRSKVLVLDEATAAVDLQTDDLIQATIRSQFVECTVITIAHRLNTIMDSDRVMVLQNGRIAEFDAPSVLLQKPNSIFYSMAKEAGIV
ncbi:multidrug resistance-associated protein 1-like isoform X2 [Portunus trituberculatus]|uniref:multidrug resistance-associated protein 1-like isoform X2 n=1 Tax=Portunus trituberculatus TaxID=210409 RepID=UPI001E1CC4E2|nr:multidrug resistance-associated protein 1-like isoform X2 [Portunus trituberculatus]XP_045113644.1 multidrug resistance-associated protein 1-like isoform X2 [Portunus trituberculatus]XP_045113645.1 multidrug resistance-associated protein 1-like isoform X2 [Portunus trituberculatus]